VAKPINVIVSRVRMATGSDQQDYAYDLFVRVADATHVDKYSATTVIRSGGEFYRFEDAYMPAQHWAMERGIERYNDYKRLEAEARVVMLELLHKAFPETADITLYPRLWISIPGFDAGHADVEIKWERLS